MLKGTINGNAESVTHSISAHSDKEPILKKA